MPIEILDATISGGYFISQVAIIGAILEARNGVKFDIHCGASGGNIASYIGIVFDKTSESLEKAVYEISSTMFIENWWADKLEWLPTSLIGAFKPGGIYKEGMGADKYIKHLLTSKFVKASTTPEIWSITFNLSDNLSELFCSKDSKSSIISKYLDNEMLLESGCQKITYCDGDLDLITKVVTASAAMPPIRPPVVIESSRHTDGGVSRASPAFLFSEALYELRNDPLNTTTYGSGGVHYFYIYPFDLLNKVSRDNDIGRSADGSHWISELIEIINSTFVNARFADRQSLMENWLRITGLSRKVLTRETATEVKVEDLRSKLAELNSKHYFIVFYTKDAYVNIEKFTRKDLQEQYKIAKDNIIYELYHN